MLDERPGRCAIALSTLRKRVRGGPPGSQELAAPDRDLEMQVYGIRTARGGQA
jgi:hypothetical protein